MARTLEVPKSSGCADAYAYEGAKYLADARACAKLAVVSPGDLKGSGSTGVSRDGCGLTPVRWGRGSRCWLTDQVNASGDEKRCRTFTTGSLPRSSKARLGGRASA